jgi:hypothetical protein
LVCWSVPDSPRLREAAIRTVGYRKIASDRRESSRAFTTPCIPRPALRPNLVTKGNAGGTGINLIPLADGSQAPDASGDPLGLGREAWMTPTDVVKGMALTFAELDELWRWHRIVSGRRRRRALVCWQGQHFAVSQGELTRAIMRRVELMATAATRSEAALATGQTRLW